MNDNFPWPQRGKPIPAEFLLIEIDDAIREELESLTPDGPPYEAGRILDTVKRRIQFYIDRNGFLPPEEHVSRGMLAVGFVEKRMDAMADDLDRRFIGYKVIDGETFAQFRPRKSRFMGSDLEDRGTSIDFTADDGEPVVVVGMKF